MKTEQTPTMPDAPAASENLILTIRENMRDRLRHEFDRFLELSTPEEQRFLYDVFNWRGSIHCGRAEELSIARGFDIAVGNWVPIT